MKNEESTYNTKKALAASLKKFMEVKPFSKVTVREIIQDCGVNRKTFYYHFEDIYALLKWMLEEEAIEVVKQYDFLVDFKEAVLFVMNYVRTNKHLLYCAYDSIGRDEMKRFFYKDFIGIIRNVINNTEEQLSIHVDPEFKEFIAHFYTEAVAGLVIEEFTDKEGHDPELAVKYLSLIVKYSLPHLMQTAAETKQKQ